MLVVVAVSVEIGLDLDMSSVSRKSVPYSTESESQGRGAPYLDFKALLCRGDSTIFSRGNAHTLHQHCSTVVTQIEKIPDQVQQLIRQ